MDLMRRASIDGRYVVERLLGSGGMARVYLAHDEVLDRRVALKILRGQYAEDGEFTRRFRREARSAASLSHPNVVSVYDQGRSEDGAYYIAMEYVPGGTLKERIRREGDLEPAVALAVALQITYALSEAHEKGDAKVADFGIAMADASASSVATATGAVLGTAAYMSPEQARGDPVGPQSDLYSLGAVLYEMLTGTLPYEAHGPIAQAMMHVNEPPRSPRQVNPEVPDPLDALTLKLLAKDPEDRYPSAAALANDLQRVRSGLPLAGADAKKTARMAAPPPPLSAAPEGRTAKTAVLPPVAAPVGTPGRGGRDRRGPRHALTALLLGVALIAGVAWALTQDFDLSGGGNQPGQEQPATAQVQVPDLTGLGEAEAVAALQNGGLEADVQRRESSWEEFELVVDQSPDSGERVEEGETVTVHVGDGPSVVTVPDLVWESEAAGTLEYEGLALGATEYVPSDFPAGPVVEMRPAEGAEVDRGTPVTIVVSTGPRQVPVSDEDEKRGEEQQKEAEKQRKREE